MSTRPSALAGAPSSKRIKLPDSFPTSAGQALVSADTSGTTVWGSVIGSVTTVPTPSHGGMVLVSSGSTAVWADDLDDGTF
jgi:hypothetical protein